MHVWGGDGRSISEPAEAQITQKYVFEQIRLFQQVIFDAGGKGRHEVYGAHRQVNNQNEMNNLKTEVFVVTC